MIKIKDQDIYKIGVSWNPEARLKALQVGIPFELELIVSVNKYDDSYVAEKKFHKNLNEYNMRGEWFKLPKHIATQTKFRMQNGIQ